MATGSKGSAPRDGHGDAPPREDAEVLRRQQLEQEAHEEALAALRSEGEAMQERIDAAHEMPPPSTREAELKLMDAARAVFGAAQDSALSTAATLDAFRTLVKADVALARASVVSATVFGMVGALAAITGWFLLVTLLVVGLVAAGLPLWGALAIAALLTLVMAGLCVLMAKRRLGSADLAATRRQWQMLRHPQQADATRGAAS